MGHTHVEAAEILGLPLGTVKTRIKNAIKELRKYFDFNTEIKLLLNIESGVISADHKQKSIENYKSDEVVLDELK